MTRQELEATEIRNEYGNFFPSYTFVEIKGEDGKVIGYDYTITKTAEEKFKEYLNPPEPQPSEMEDLLAKVNELTESQDVQNSAIDMMMFEVIPNIESRLPQEEQLVMMSITKVMRGGETMGAYFADRIIRGVVTYEACFRISFYKKYQDETDAILELEGHGDLIKR